MADHLEGTAEDLSPEKKVFETTQSNARESPESVSERRGDGVADDATISRIYR